MLRTVQVSFFKNTNQIDLHFRVVYSIQGNKPPFVFGESKSVYKTRRKGWNWCSLVGIFGDLYTSKKVRLRLKIKYKCEGNIDEWWQQRIPIWSRWGRNLHRCLQLLQLACRAFVIAVATYKKTRKESKSSFRIDVNAKLFA